MSVECIAGAIHAGLVVHRGSIFVAVSGCAVTPFFCCCSHQSFVVVHIRSCDCKHDWQALVQSVSHRSVVSHRVQRQPAHCVVTAVASLLVT
jgi:hypothetical protein